MQKPAILCVPPVFPEPPDPTGLPAELRPGPAPRCGLGHTSAVWSTGTAAEIRAGPSPAPCHGDEEDGGWQDWASAGALGPRPQDPGGSILQLWLLLLFNRSMLPFTLKLKAELHLLSSEAHRRRRRSHVIGTGWDRSWGGMEAFQQRSDVAWLTSSKVSLSET